MRDKLKYNYAQTQHKFRKRKAVLSLLGDKCKNCGITDTRVLQIDHVNGGGWKEFKKYNKNRVKIYNHILQGILPKNNYQLLCANCNWIKRYENKEYT